MDYLMNANKKLYRKLLIVRNANQNLQQRIINSPYQNLQHRIINSPNHNKCNRCNNVKYLAFWMKLQIEILNKPQLESVTIPELMQIP